MKKKKTRVCISLGVCLFLLLTTAAAFAKMVSIAGNDVNMRSGAGTKYRVLWELSNGFPLKVYRQSGQWLRVSDFEGTIGWVRRDMVNMSAHMIVKVNKNSKKRINVRSGPGTKYRIVAKAYYGVVFKTLNKKNGWVHVRHEQGVTGWVKRSLLWGW
ncbi:SH3 domain-containing protein [bacterium BMS3Bbin14]|nr:SH3 domain-containing protein [bacterium BMS3Abin13]GBE52527.1 SH3 domain-containing protein [bacterium BMS3Bbin14]HDL98842.1 peptide-binding protein [Desulfobacteraceae bacterium]HDO30638.1 peptide-binding protein [Desulfobacteraceae bacterium]HDZ75844.1 peptide-binding protein [Desulfobacteraceae bacterium]